MGESRETRELKNFMFLMKPPVLGLARRQLVRNLLKIKKLYLRQGECLPSKIELSCKIKKPVKVSLNYRKLFW